MLALDRGDRFILSIVPPPVYRSPRKKRRASHEEPRTVSCPPRRLSFSLLPVIAKCSPVDSIPLHCCEPREEPPVRSHALKIHRHVPYRVLDAPELRNDFYCNLVSWSSLTQNVAVGLGKHVYLWHKVSGVIHVELNDTSGAITCVAFSNNDYLVVGTIHGRVSLVSQRLVRVITCVCKFDTSVCCVTWTKLGDVFYLGEGGGVVRCYRVVGGLSPSLVEIMTLVSHRQQVCGIALSADETEIAVGGNDNTCTVWDVTDMTAPRLKFSLPHYAAVKAVAYCPWSRSLLATGGGTKDRLIRFWHTNLGTLLRQFDTQHQVTSVVWSTLQRQLVATFGFGDGPQRLLAAAYTYPQLRRAHEVVATPNLRILSTVVSPDRASICMATNDETVRFYKLWQPSRHSLRASAAWGAGTYGSSLIELDEGIDPRGAPFR